MGLVGWLDLFSVGCYLVCFGLLFCYVGVVLAWFMYLVVMLFLVFASGRAVFAG